MLHPLAQKETTFMLYWKQVLGRLALSTASLTIIASLGAFLGAILGAVLELMLQAIVGLAVSPLLVIPLFMAVGLLVGFIWGLAIVVQHRAHATLPPHLPR